MNIPDVTLCIPTYLKYDLCVKLIKSTEAGSLKPVAYKIVDNGGTFHNYIKTHPLPPGIDIHIHKPGKNIGVACAWNYFLKTNKNKLLLISNDDILVSCHDIEKIVTLYMMEQEKKDNKYIIFGPRGSVFSFFLSHSSILDIVGPFDESFYPAYFEDVDYHRRLALMGLEVFHVRVLKLNHAGSSTIKEQEKRGKIEEHHASFRKNRSYYIRKWGGLPGEEKYTKPFNK